MQLNTSQHKLLKGLLLTSSVDWTVKLWDPTRPRFPLLECSTLACDYVSDAQWNPINAAMFATICSGGIVSLWHLGRSSLQPIDSINLHSTGTDGDTVANNNSGRGVSASSTSGNAVGAAGGALNKCSWSKDGLGLVVGSARGSLAWLSASEACLRLSAAEESNLESVLRPNALQSNFSPMSNTLSHTPAPMSARPSGNTPTPSLEED
jgi:WD40 repeat protein